MDRFKPHEDRIPPNGYYWMWDDRVIHCRVVVVSNIRGSGVDVVSGDWAFPDPDVDQANYSDCVLIGPIVVPKVDDFLDQGVREFVKPRPPNRRPHKPEVAKPIIVPVGIGFF